MTQFPRRFFALTLLFSFVIGTSNAMAYDLGKVVTDTINTRPSVTPKDIPEASTDHPRLWITKKDLPTLRSWATSDNPMYVIIKDKVDEIKKGYNAKTNTLKCVDDGISTFPRCPVESDSALLAFDSLINPDPIKRKESAKIAHDIFMPVMTEIAKGIDEKSKYRVSTFFNRDRSRVFGHDFPLTVDWINDTFTKAEKKTISKAFYIWQNNVNYKYATNKEGWLYKNVKLISDKLNLRWVANNYMEGFFDIATLFSIAVDAEDDPPLNPKLSPSTIGNSIRSYRHLVFGSWLPQHLALFIGGQDVYKKLYAFFEVPYPKDLTYFGGDGADGMSIEGGPFYYAGDAFGAQLNGYLGLYTAGYTDPVKFGPGIEMLTSDFWEKNVTGWLSSIPPKSTILKGAEWMGDVYEIAHYGQTQTVVAPGTNTGMFAKLAILARLRGDKKMLNATKWILINALAGGEKKFLQRSKGDPVELFLAFDPNDKTPITDPRPELPTSFLVKPQARILARTDWSPNQSWFTYVCSFATIDHEMGNCNMFTFYRKGEWLTKERDGYSSADPTILDTTDYQNALSVQNTYLMEKPNVIYLDRGAYLRGGQFMFAAGDPTVQTSLQKDYVYANSDATNRYNRKVQNGDATDVKHVSRSILWIKPDHIIIYDRATTGLDGKFKRFNLNLPTEPVIKGNTATMTTEKGQKFYLTSLLPTGGIIKSMPFEKDADAYGNVGKYRLYIENTANPKDIRFLTILQGADAKVAADKTSYVKNTAGIPYEGTIVGDKAIMFPVNFSDNLKDTTFKITSAVKNIYLTGLKPGTTYTIKITKNGTSKTVNVKEGGTEKADEAGVILKKV